LLKSKLAKVRAKNIGYSWLSAIAMVRKHFFLSYNLRSFWKLARTLAIDIGAPILWQ
jgi:hypothetical protein